MKLIKLFIACAVVASCNTPKAVYDYDDTINFNKYRTYGFFPEFQSDLSQLDETRLITSLKNGMQNEGFAVSEEPDIFINAFSREFVDQNRNRVGVGLGGGSGNIGVGVSGGIPLRSNLVILEITLDFIKAEEDSLIWQAVVETKFNPNASPEDRRKMFDSMVKKALEGYPPKK